MYINLKLLKFCNVLNYAKFLHENGEESYPENMVIYISGQQ